MGARGNFASVTQNIDFLDRKRLKLILKLIKSKY